MGKHSKAQIMAYRQRRKLQKRKLKKTLKPCSNLDDSVENHSNSTVVSGVCTLSSTLEESSDFINSNLSTAHSAKTTTHSNETSEVSNYTHYSTKKSVSTSESEYTNRTCNTSEYRSISFSVTCLEHGESCSSKLCKYKMISPEIYNDPLFIGGKIKKCSRAPSALRFGVFAAVNTVSSFFSCSTSLIRPVDQHLLSFEG